MTRSLRITDGDLTVTPSGVSLVSKTEKLKQDLSLWLREVFGVDRFHPYYGSTLDSYVGQAMRPQEIAFLKSEVVRVLQNYQKVQQLGMRENPSLYSPEEVLAEVISVNPHSNYDTLKVDIVFRNGAGQINTVKAGAK